MAIHRFFYPRKKHYFLCFIQQKASVFFKKNNAVSEILGTILLLSISIALFSSLYLLVTQVSTSYTHELTQQVTLVGSIEGNSVVFRHLGGDELVSKIKVSVIIAGETHSYILGESTDGFAFSGSEHRWKIGDEVTYTQSVSLGNMEVVGRIEDISTHRIILDVTLQTGEKGDVPYVLTHVDPTTDLTTASVSLYYNFIDFSRFTARYVMIQYCSIDHTLLPLDPQNPTNPPQHNYVMSANIDDNRPVAANFGFEIIGLDSETTYRFRAAIAYTYNNQPYIKYGDSLIFVTKSEIVGHWKFDEGTGRIAYDQTRNYNNGTLQPGMIGPSWVQRENSYSTDYALSFDGIDDYVQVPDSNSLDLTKNLQIDFKMKPLEYADKNVGSIVSNIAGGLSSFGPRYYDCYEADVAFVSDTGDGKIYAIVSRNQNASPHGYLVTVKIRNDGSIVNTTNGCFIDFFVFQNQSGVGCFNPKIIRSGGPNNVFVLVWSRGGGNGIGLRTLYITNTGFIQIPPGNPGIVRSAHTRCYHPDIDFIDSISDESRYFVVVYSLGVNYLGIVETFRVTSSGSLTFMSTIGNFSHNYSSNPLAEGKAIQPEVLKIKEDANFYYFTVAFMHGDGAFRTIKIKKTNPNQFHVHSISLRDNSLDAGNCQSPEIIKVADGSEPLIAVVYGGPSEDSSQIVGKIRTFRYTDTNYQLITSYTFEPAVNHFFEPDIIELERSGDMGYYAIVYRGPSGSSDTYCCIIKTIEINVNTGVITPSIKDSIIIQLRVNSNADPYEPQIFLISNSLFGVVYRQKNYDGVLKTVQFSSGGMIDDTYPVRGVHTLGLFCVYDNNAMYKLKEDDGSGIYALFHQGLNHDAYIKTIRIFNSGVISNQIITNYVISLGRLASPSSSYLLNIFETPNFNYIRAVGSNHLFAVVFRGANGNLWIKTFTISNDGIVITLKQSFDFSYFGMYPFLGPSIQQGSQILYPLVYRISGSVGYIQLVSFTDEGAVNLHGTPTEFGTPSSLYYPSIIRIADTNLFVLGSVYEDYVLRLRTFTVTSNTITFIDFLSISQLSLINFFTINQVGAHDEQSFITLIYTRREYPHTGLMTVYALNTTTGKFISTTPIDQFVFEGGFSYPQIFHLRERIYAVFYRAGSGKIKTIRIDQTTGNIVDTFDSFSEFDPNSPFDGYPTPFSIVQVHDSTYAIFYGGYSYFNGYVKIVKLPIAHSDKPDGLIVKKNAYAVYGQVTDNVVRIRATIFVGGQNITCWNNYTVNPLIVFYLIRVRYDFQTATLTLRIEDQEESKQNSSYMGVPIVTTSEPLVIGGCHAILDDVVIRTLFKDA
ncbi:MAG: type IV pilin N-terminal domain-containing protein [Candidatus Thermoplasmatota archaeon]